MQRRVAIGHGGVGVGAEIEVSLGGHTDPSMGLPVKARAVVKMLSDGTFRNNGPMNAGVETQMGPTAVLRLGGVDGGIDEATLGQHGLGLTLQTQRDLHVDGLVHVDGEEVDVAHGALDRVALEILDDRRVAGAGHLELQSALTGTDCSDAGVAGYDVCLTVNQGETTSAWGTDGAYTSKFSKGEGHSYVPGA